MQTQDHGSAGGTLSGSSDVAREKLDRAASKAHDTVDTVHRHATEVSERVTSETDRMYQATCDWISHHPMQAVASAVLAGYLFGRLRR